MGVSLTNDPRYPIYLSQQEGSVLPEHSAYRHELKYQISPAEYCILRQRLRTLMQPDPHAGPDGRYQITSLYFDNFADKALREKLDGLSRREKFRLRRYGEDLQYIHLEKKQKISGLCLKSSAVLDPEDCQRLLAGDQNWLANTTSELAQELAFQMQSQLLRPRTLVGYTREAYIYPAGNVRITFDFDLFTAQDPSVFLRPDPGIIPVAGGQMLMELKYDGFLPSHLADALQLGTLRVRAFSKYAACRTLY